VGDTEEREREREREREEKRNIMPIAIGIGTISCSGRSRLIMTSCTAHDNHVIATVGDLHANKEEDKEDINDSNIGRNSRNDQKKSNIFQDPGPSTNGGSQLFSYGSAGMYSNHSAHMSMRCNARLLLCVVIRCCHIC
jgi:hypothetical protein